MISFYQKTSCRFKFKVKILWVSGATPGHAAPYTVVPEGPPERRKQGARGTIGFREPRPLNSFLPGSRGTFAESRAHRSPPGNPRKTAISAQMTHARVTTDIREACATGFRNSRFRGARGTEFAAILREARQLNEERCAGPRCSRKRACRVLFCACSERAALDLLATISFVTVTPRKKFMRTLQAFLRN